ncbi:MAG: DNA-binding response regulator [Bacteroidetes bacterium]|nr:MAG: DNA-binding response regulator [Bacteroidota bacterium]RLD90745.1 MAG: DNA-binding response regulator [Bacteroidota bacterium]RLE05594.1 MAG: DNA-binding response regulator [Bacteroidota bacterium]
MRIKCLIIEDEPIAREVLRDYIGKLDDFKIAGEFENALEALSFMKQNRVDLIFLDINMPQLSGIEFLRSLSHPPKTIITTAHRKYALEGFDLQVLDYLLKPYSFERFFQAIEKYYETLAYPVTLHNIDSPISSTAYLYLKDNRKTYKVYLSDISLIESKGEYVQVRSGKKVVMTRSSLTAIEQLLPNDQFIRTHNSFIVSIDHISAFTASTIEVGETEIPISRKYKNMVMKSLKDAK